MKMELNSLGTAREDTHGTPSKSRGKMHSLPFFVLSFVPYSQPTPSPNPIRRPFPSFFHRNLPPPTPTPTSILPPRSPPRRSSRFGIRLRTRVECLRLAHVASSVQPFPLCQPAFSRPPFTLSDGWCKWARDAESCSFSSKYSPVEYIYMYIPVVYAFS